MNTPSPRQPARAAPPELLVLQKAEALAIHLLTRTARWPKSQRFTLTQRLENVALDVVEQLVIARYEAHERGRRLASINLALERARFLLRLARAGRHCPAQHFEGLMTRIDEVGRMLHGWRERLAGRRTEAAPTTKEATP